MRFDLLMVIIGLVLVTAMVLTLLFGKEFSRHGYGAVIHLFDKQPASLSTSV